MLILSLLLESIYIFFIAFIVFFGSLFGLDSDVSTAILPENRSYYKGKIVVVTGASAGIGESFARYVSKCGATVILVARRESELKRVQVACKKDGATTVHTIAFDMANIEKMPTLVETIYNLCGRIDILLNNAGRTQRGLATETPAEDTRALFEVNTLSVIELSRLVAARMETQTVWSSDNFTRGHIAVTSSVSGKGNTPGSSSYVATKFAVNGYLGSLRNEMAFKGIRVSLLCPGPVDTDIGLNSIKGDCIPAHSKEVDLERLERRRMSADRCALLMANSISHNCRESWIASDLSLFFAYASVYMPGITALLGEKILGPARVKSLMSGVLGYGEVFKAFIPAFMRN